jgi:hypothetical protein
MQKIHQWHTTMTGGKIAFGMLGSYLSDRVVIKGNCSEICRCFYYNKGNHPPFIPVNQIIDLEGGWRELPFACEAISEWYDKTKSVSEATGVDLLDLFYWEHRMGSWQAQSQLEQDIAQETYTPFNHRGLLEKMLSIPTSYRSAPHYDLYKKLCEALWPDVLNEPINPSDDITNNSQEKLKRLLRLFGLEKITKNIYTYFFKKA